MEHNHHDLHEAAHVTDEALEGVSGGAITMGNLFMCTNCNKMFPIAHEAIHLGKKICRTCYSQLQNGDASASAAAAAASAKAKAL